MKKLISMLILGGLTLLPGTVWAQDVTRMDNVFMSTDFGLAPGDMSAGVGLNYALAALRPGIELVMGTSVLAGKADDTGTGQARFPASIGAFWQRKIGAMYGYDFRTKDKNIMVKVGLVEW